METKQDKEKVLREFLEVIETGRCFEMDRVSCWSEEAKRLLDELYGEDRLKSSPKKKLCPGCFPGDEDAGSFEDLCEFCEKSLVEGMLLGNIIAHKRATDV